MLKAALQYSFLLQQNVLEPLYVGLVAIKLVNRRNFQAKSSGVIKHHCSYFTEADATALSMEKGDCLSLKYVPLHSCILSQPQ